METISVAAYNYEWPHVFEEEAARIRDTFPGDIDIEHVGSTSVPDLDAKPIIDIILGFKELNAPYIIEQMESLGYEHWKEDTFQHIRLMFTKWNKDKSKRLVNVHATVKGSDFWNELLVLRDKLRSNKEFAKEYADLKKKLAETHKNDPELYTTAKTEFIKRILSQ